MGGREAEVVVVGGQAEGGFSLPLGHDISTMYSVGNRDVHKQQDRLRQPLATVWHPINSD